MFAGSKPYSFGQSVCLCWWRRWLLQTEAWICQLCNYMKKDIKWLTSVYLSAVSRNSQHLPFHVAQFGRRVWDRKTKVRLGCDCSAVWCNTTPSSSPRGGLTVRFSHFHNEFHPLFVQNHLVIVTAHVNGGVVGFEGPFKFSHVEQGLGESVVALHTQGWNKVQVSF